MFAAREDWWLSGWIYPCNASVALTLTPTVSRTVNLVSSLTLTLTPTLARVVNRPVGTTLTLTPSVARVVNRTASVTLSLVPTIQRFINMLPINLVLQMNSTETDDGGPVHGGGELPPWLQGRHQPR